MRRAVRLLACAAAAACGGSGHDTGRVEVGAPAPAYAAHTLTGDSVTLASLRGKPVLLNVWATWCHPCREEIPALERLHARYQPRGLQLVGVSVDAAGEEPAIRDFAREFRMTYPIWLDPDERVSSTFLLVGVPGTFLIGKDGKLLWRRQGPIRDGDTSLVRAIEGSL
jgi:cytochrome c biogenesis protein CcmG, thiol:disulfide interchange protein DsbE